MVSSTGRPHHYGPSKWRGGKAKLISFEKDTDRASRGQTVEGRSWLLTPPVSPAELLFGRKIRTKLPEFREDHEASEVPDRDGEMNSKAKLYADKKRHAEYSDLVPGDRVLLKQEKQNKLSTTFAPEPYDVVSRNGSSIVIKSPEGVQLERNTAHVKKYEEPPPMPSQTVPLPVEKDIQAESPPLLADLETNGGKEGNAVSKRPSLVDLQTECRKARTATEQHAHDT